MPGRNGTGPFGKEPVFGRGTGRGGQHVPMVAGSTGNCVCPNCREKIEHVVDTPCTLIKCLKCGTTMIRGF